MTKSPLKQYRESRLIGKAELARKANLSETTIWRIENGFSCRWETKRRILNALGLKLDKRFSIFNE